MRYLTVEELLVLHSRLIGTSGGSLGVRDANALDSAVAQPLMTFGGIDLYETIARKAAALGHSLISNHPFVDGNKRVGHAAMEVMLLLNGYEIVATVDDHVARRHPRQELHVVLDNSSTHGTAEVKEWLAKNPRVHFHYTPTSASWLNQVEGFFGILGKQSLGVAHFPSKVALREHIDAYITHWNDDPTPFIWTKPAAAIIRSRKRMLDRISHAVHTAPLAKTLMW
jgi:death on curing protein